MSKFDRLERRNDLGIARGRLLVGILYGIPQGTDRNVGLLRQEQHASASRYVHMAAPERPDAGQCAEQRALAAAAGASDQRCLPFCQLYPSVLEKRVAVRQSEREVLGAYRRDIRLP